MSPGASLWTMADVVAACEGRGDVDFAARGVSIDSRSLAPGDLFVALVGPNFDGHDFVAEALEKGASGAVAARRPAGIRAASPLVLVGDTTVALTALGGAGRQRAQARVAAVTGSVGKTGTKEALALVLGRQGPTGASLGSLNNHWGVPLSLARLHPACRFGVFEMGMNHPGEIAPLSRLARPDVAVITTVEAVHGAHFDSVEAIAEAKAEVFTGMVPGGTAVLNRDNAHFPRLAAAAAEHGLAVLGFGADGDAALRLDAEYLEPESSRVVVELGGRRIGYALGAPGAHWVRNSLAVLGAVHALGADVDAAAADLADVHPPQGRGRRHSVAVAGGAFDLIDESYNASQVSMLAAMRVLGRMPPGAGGRRMAVLGDMLEIGETAAEMHRALAGAVIEAGIDLVFTAGPLMTHLWDALPAALRGGHAGDIETLAPLVVAAVRPGDVVTVKGSLGSRTGVVVRALLDLGGDDEAAPRRAAMRE